jgi:hypothetical protein
VVFKILRTDAVNIIKLNIRPIGRHYPRSSSLPHVDTCPTVSSISGMLPGSPYLSECQALCDSAWISSMLLNRRPSSFNFIFGNRKKSHGAKSREYGGWGDSHFVFRQKLLLLLVSSQDPVHKFGYEMLHAQFFRQNTFACPINSSHLLSNVVNGPNSILADELLNSCNSFRSCAACGCVCSSSSTDMRSVLNQACH